MKFGYFIYNFDLDIPNLFENRKKYKEKLNKLYLSVEFDKT